MQDLGLYHILDLPEASLKRILPKATSRCLVRLVNAYPRTAGNTFFDVLTSCVSPATMEFLLDEQNCSTQPTFLEIRQAESELIKLMQSENVLPTLDH
jgi:hypothetical protein